MVQVNCQNGDGGGSRVGECNFDEFVFRMNTPTPTWPHENGTSGLLAFFPVVAAVCPFEANPPDDEATLVIFNLVEFLLEPSSCKP